MHKQRRCRRRGSNPHTLAILDFESSASASSATPAFRAGQKLRRSSRACKPRGGPRTSRRITAWRILARRRSNLLNGWRGTSRAGRSRARHRRRRGWQRDWRWRRNGDRWRDLDRGRLERSGRWRRRAEIFGRRNQRRQRLHPIALRSWPLRRRSHRCDHPARADRWRRARSWRRPERLEETADSFLLALRRRTRGGACSLGEGGSGFSASPEAWLVSHLKISASPPRTRKMSVSFIAAMSSAHSSIVRITFPSTVFPWRQSLPASSCRPARFSFARNP